MQQNEQYILIRDGNDTNPIIWYRYINSDDIVSYHNQCSIFKAYALSSVQKLHSYR